MPLVATAQEAAGREPEVLCRFAFETRLIRGRGCCREPHQPGQGLLRSVNDNIVRFVESQFQQTLRGPPLRSGSSSSDWRGNIKARETAELKARMAGFGWAIASLHSLPDEKRTLDQTSHCAV